MTKKTDRRRLLKQMAFTLFVIVLYRIGAAIPIPGVDIEALKSMSGGGNPEGVTAVLNLFSGGALASASILAVGITPFISASLGFQLLNGVIPSLRAMQKQGPSGQKKIASFTRITALGLAILQSFVVVNILRNGMSDGLFPVDLYPRHEFIFTLLAVGTLTTGFLAMLWLAEQVSKKGVGNGVSLIILASVLSTVVGQSQSVFTQSGWEGTLLLGGITLVALGAVAALSQVERRIEITTAKQVGARRGRANSFVPLRLLQASVAPVIFASTMLGVFNLLVVFLPTKNIVRVFFEGLASGGNPWSILVLAALVIFFTYFYTAVQFNTSEISDDLAKRGMFMPGIRPGSDTAYHLAWILSRLAVAGGIVLAIVAVMPLIVQNFTGVTNIPLLGVTLLIATSVTTETARQIKAKQSLYDYDTIIEGKTSDNTNMLKPVS